jgi:DNA-binding CsgD family transcriptional regulator
MTGFCDPLNPLQLEVAVLLADTDLKPEEIAARLGLTPPKLRDIVFQAHRLMRVNSRARLRSVMLAFELAPAGGVR